APIDGSASMLAWNFSQAASISPRSSRALPSRKSASAVALSAAALVLGQPITQATISHHSTRVTSTSRELLGFEYMMIVMWRVQRFAAAMVSIVCVNVLGCSEILGLGDYRDPPVGAGGAGGSGGASQGGSPAT